ncbi:MAG: SGNH/GDSL hydrolase family protein [Acidimicrobiales bacterium]
MTIPRTKLRSRLTIVLCALLSLWSVVAGGFNASASATSPVSSSPNSIVQLGDSIASGEGTLYGFTFNSATGKWVGPANPNPTWAGPYQDCHQSADAYGHVLAATYPKASFTQLACTGATFDKGISGPWSANVPPEFGNWDTRTALNPRYSAADPNLVLVTLGADDVKFVDIVTQCAEYVYYHPLSAVQCTAAQPNGPSDVVKHDFTDYIPTLEKNLTTLAGWIEARGTRLGSKDHPPKIVFTTYANPLPANAPAGGKNFCPDTWLLYNDQLTYFSSLVAQLDKDIVTTINAYATEHHDTNIAVADLSNTYDGHQWCATDTGGAYIAPMAYGFSIYPHYSSLKDPNPAAFHPTPAGQKAIATKVEAVVAQLFKSS